MDREQEEIQFLGFFGILKESHIVSSWRKIFSQITLVWFLPLSFIYLLHIQITVLLFAKIVNNEYTLVTTPEGTRSYDKISNILSSEWTTCLLFKIGHVIFFLVLALLSAPAVASAVVSTIACIYSAKEITFKKAMSVVPKVWKRLVVTFIWNFVFVFAYNIMALLILILGVMLLGPIKIVGTLFLILFSVVFFIGFLYINIWQLASVVSVLEECYGRNAMAKSQGWIKGQAGNSAADVLLLGLCYFGGEKVLEILVVIEYENIFKGLVGYRIGLGIVCLTLMSILMLFGHSIQTIVYFVCKTYHHENNDKSSGPSRIKTNKYQIDENNNKSSGPSRIRTNKYQIE